MTKLMAITLPVCEPCVAIARSTLSGAVRWEDSGRDGNDPSADRRNDTGNEGLDDRLEALAQGEGDDHEDRRDQDDEALDQADGQDQDLADELGVGRPW